MIFIIIIIGLIVFNASVWFRYCYLRQKVKGLEHGVQTTPEWFSQVEKVCDDFWSFLK